jgi:putative redox protein
MKIEINRLNNTFHMEALNETGAKIEMDSSTDHGGNDLGFRPMQLLLAGIGGCSAIDVIEILKKQRQDLKDIKITVSGEREPDKVPSLWQAIHVHYKLFGSIDENKAKQAIELSVNKYCSVAKTLEQTAEITYSFEVITA